MDSRFKKSSSRSPSSPSGPPVRHVQDTTPSSPEEKERPVRRVQETTPPSSEEKERPVTRVQDTTPSSPEEKDPPVRFVPETICGRQDERFQVDPMTSPPYKWICFLTITSATGNKTYLGSGFKIHYPVDGLDCAVIVTSGHCTYVDGKYAKKITVKFPGEEPIDVTDQKDLYAAPEYIRAIENGDYGPVRAENDYGLIALRGARYSGFGWATRVYQDLNKDHLVTNCGYPGDKPKGTMWITGGEIERYTPKSVFYMNDTMAGQSGSPVYTWQGGYWTVIAVHSYGGCPNSGPRFTRQMIYRFGVFLKGDQLKPDDIPLAALPRM